jgi:hypothetical protein
LVTIRIFVNQATEESGSKGSEAVHDEEDRNQELRDPAGDDGEGGDHDREATGGEDRFNIAKNKAGTEDEKNSVDGQGQGREGGEGGGPKDDSQGDDMPHGICGEGPKENDQKPNEDIVSKEF